jgi:hypothetical protein
MGKLLVDDNCGRWPSYIFLPAFLLVVGYALVNFAFMFKGQSVALVGAFDKFGYDFRDFHRAGKYLEIGKDPYSWERFVTPPFFSRNNGYIFLPAAKCSHKVILYNKR